MLRKIFKNLALKARKCLTPLFSLSMIVYMSKCHLSYKKLWMLLIEKDISSVQLRTELNIATGTMTKLRKNEEVAMSVLLRVCEYLKCNIGDIVDVIFVEESLD